MPHAMVAACVSEATSGGTTHQVEVAVVGAGFAGLYLLHRFRKAGFTTLVLEEADESVFWVEMLSETGITKAERLESLLGEARELTAIFTSSQRTGRNGK